MIPAQRVYFFLLLGMAISLLIANFISLSLAVGFLLGFDLLVLAVMVFDGWRVKSQRVKITRQPLGRLSIGRDNPVVLQVESQSAATLQICDRYPCEFEASSPRLVTQIPAQSIQELPYTVNPKQRGQYLWGDIQVRQLSPLRLAWHQWTIPGETKIAVYPDLVGLRQLSIRLTLQETGTMRQARRSGIGTEFAEMREYRIGDDLRFVDWKATAKREGMGVMTPLQMRVLEPEKEQTLIILLDRGRLMTARVKGLKRFDWGLNATLALALAGLNRGDRVGVGVFDREVVTWIPPERGQHHLSKLIDRLTPIQPTLLEPDYMGAVSKLVSQQTRRALVVMITDIVDTTASAELLAALSRLTPRYLPFCVTLRDSQIDAQAHHFLPDIKSAYRRAVALDLLSQRQIAFAQLKQKGVLVLDAPAHQISEPLVNQYLQLKARNRI